MNEEGGEGEGGSFNVLAFVLPGFSIMGILFLAQSATRDILVDRETGMLRHLLTAPVNATDFLIGKCLSVFAVTALGFVIFILIGIAGGLLGGYIGTTLGLGTVTGLNIPSLLLAIGGAVILLFAYRLIRK